MTYRDLVNGVMFALRESSEALSVDQDRIYFMKPGEMPIEAPFILMDTVVEPSDKSENTSVAKAIVTLFSGADNSVDAQEASIECHERLIIAINVMKLSSVKPRHVKTIRSDGQYPGYAVAFVELEYMISLSGV